MKQRILALFLALTLFFCAAPVSLAADYTPQQQLEILQETLDARFGLRVSFGDPAVIYRETIREIEEIEGNDGADEISEILGKRDADGKPGAVRKDRTKL